MNFCSIISVPLTLYICLATEVLVVNPCLPSPCGPYSQCREVHGQAVCSCLQAYIGSPPSCRPECMISSECPFDKACVNQKCVNPCLNICGPYTVCRVVRHSPICSCQPGYTGDAFSQCYLIPGSCLRISINI